MNVSEESYAAYLGERVDVRDDHFGLAALRKTKTGELYLTCACASGIEAPSRHSTPRIWTGSNIRLRE